MMDYVPGRVFQDPSLPGMTKEERSAIYDATVDAISRIHLVDVKKAGLEDFGKHGKSTVSALDCKLWYRVL